MNLSLLGASKQPPKTSISPKISSYIFSPDSDLEPYARQKRSYYSNYNRGRGGYGYGRGYGYYGAGKMGGGGGGGGGGDSSEEDGGGGGGGGDLTLLLTLLKLLNESAHTNYDPLFLFQAAKWAVLANLTAEEATRSPAPPGRAEAAAAAAVALMTEAVVEEEEVT